MTVIKRTDSLIKVGDTIVVCDKNETSAQISITIITKPVCR